MEYFLRQVARHYFDAPDIGNSLFVFPSRRAGLFFRKYLCEFAAERSVVILAPRIETIGDFICRMDGKSISGKITLLLKLYDCYKSCYGEQAEGIDDFVYWGGVILGDFDDVDKYLADANSLFRNISDLKEMGDDFSYANEKQKDAIGQLLGHYISSDKAGGVKEEFRKIWNLLYPLYESFRKCLQKDGLAYEGMIYKDLAERLGKESATDILSQAYPKAEKVVFVGLNALSASEKRILGRLRDASLAEFCWDFAGSYMADDDNPCSLFRKENLELFPQAFPLEAHRDKLPIVRSIKIPSSTAQARLIPKLLEQVPPEERGTDFAVVLADESLLQSVLGSLPSLPGGVNITMGYPLKLSEWYSLIRDILAAQMHLRVVGDRVWFYHKNVRDILSSSVIRTLSGDEEQATYQKILQEAKYYIPVEDLTSTSLLKLIFRPVVTMPASPSAEQTDSLADYLLELTRSLGELLSGTDESDDGQEESEGKLPLQAEFAILFYRVLNSLKGISFGDGILPRTWIHLLDELVKAQSVPFEGEPLNGLQIMGPLETRALDFKHIVILGANEAVFPKVGAAPSFIPAQIRTAFGLPTYLRQDAMWAYYFYRLLTRCEDLTLSYDSRTQGLKSGEESRFIKQLRYLYPETCTFSEYIAEAEVRASEDDSQIPKTAEDIDIIRKFCFSATALSDYISCPAKFYYAHIKGLRPENEVREAVDAGLLGDIAHDTLAELFCGEEYMLSDVPFDKTRGPLPFMKWISRDYLEQWLSPGREEDIRRKVRSIACRKLHTPQITGRDIVTVEVIVRFVRQVISCDVESLATRSGFRLLGIEKRLVINDICGYSFKGYVDRIDSWEEGQIRIVDYKTGKDAQEVLGPGYDARKIFSPDTAHEAKAALQFFIYDNLVSKNEAFHRSLLKEGFSEGSCVMNSMYAMGGIFTKKVEVYPQSEVKNSAISSGLQRLFAEMEDPGIPFVRAADGGEYSPCKWCDFNVICGRVRKNG